MLQCRTRSHLGNYSSFSASHRLGCAILPAVLQPRWICRPDREGRVRGNERQSGARENERRPSDRRLQAHAGDVRPVRRFCSHRRPAAHRARSLWFFQLHEMGAWRHRRLHRVQPCAKPRRNARRRDECAPRHSLLDPLDLDSPPRLPRWLHGCRRRLVFRPLLACCDDLFHAHRKLPRWSEGLVPHLPLREHDGLLGPSQEHVRHHRWGVWGHAHGLHRCHGGHLRDLPPLPLHGSQKGHVGPPQDDDPFPSGPERRRQQIHRRGGRRLRQGRGDCGRVEGSSKCAWRERWQLLVRALRLELLHPSLPAQPQGRDAEARIPHLLHPEGDGRRMGGAACRQGQPQGVGNKYRGHAGYVRRCHRGKGEPEGYQGRGARGRDQQDPRGERRQQYCRLPPQLSGSGIDRLRQAGQAAGLPERPGGLRLLVGHHVLCARLRARLEPHHGRDNGAPQRLIAVHHHIPLLFRLGLSQLRRRCPSLQRGHRAQRGLLAGLSARLRALGEHEEVPGYRARYGWWTARVPLTHAAAGLGPAVICVALFVYIFVTSLIKFGSAEWALTGMLLGVFGSGQMLAPTGASHSAADVQKELAGAYSGIIMAVISILTMTVVDLILAQPLLGKEDSKISTIKAYKGFLDSVQSVLVGLVGSGKGRDKGTADEVKRLLGGKNNKDNLLSYIEGMGGKLNAMDSHISIAKNSSPMDLYEGLSSSGRGILDDLWILAGAVAEKGSDNLKDDLSTVLDAMSKPSDMFEDIYSFLEGRGDSGLMNASSATEGLALVKDKQDDMSKGAGDISISDPVVGYAVKNLLTLKKQVWDAAKAAA